MVCIGEFFGMRIVMLLRFCCDIVMILIGVLCVVSVSSVELLRKLRLIVLLFRFLVIGVVVWKCFYLIV